MREVIWITRDVRRMPDHDMRILMDRAGQRYGVEPFPGRSSWPRISPPGKSPGPVFVGATPSFVCTLTYVRPARIASSNGMSRPTADAGQMTPVGLNVPDASTPFCGPVGPVSATPDGPMFGYSHMRIGPFTPGNPQ